MHKQAQLDMPTAFCWTRMGAEAGEDLSQIIRRKELERRACGGTFLWGIGNSLGTNVALLRRTVLQPTVVFSAMRSKPKAADSSPKALRIWLSYIGEDGHEHELPRAGLVTSRAHTANGQAKDVHYALICVARKPIDGGPGGRLDASLLVNLASGRSVGASQVTSVVRVVESSTNAAMHYPIKFSAQLVTQVRLARWATVESAELRPAIRAVQDCDPVGWAAALAELKRAATARTEHSTELKGQSSQGRMFA